MRSDLDLKLMKRRIPADILRIILYDFFPFPEHGIHLRKLSEDHQSNNHRFICTELKRQEIIATPFRKEGSGIFKVRYVSAIRPQQCTDTQIDLKDETRFDESIGSIIFHTTELYLHAYSCYNYLMPVYQWNSRLKPSRPQTKDTWHRGHLFPKITWNAIIKNSPSGIIIMKSTAVIEDVQTHLPTPYATGFTIMTYASPDEQIFEHSYLTGKFFR